MDRPLRSIELEIESLGALGDGLGTLADGTRIYVPYAAVGDRLIVALEGRRGDGAVGRIVEILHPGPGRAQSPCRHFGRCGGCALQHIDEASYRRWKIEQVETALRRSGLGNDAISDLVSIPPHTRRRAALVALGRGNGVELGFHARASRSVVDLDECHVLTPALTALLAPLRAALGPWLTAGKTADIVLTDTATGIDMLVAAKTAPSLAARRHLTDLGRAHDLARISWSRAGAEPEPIMQQRQPRLRFGDVAIDLPPGAFIQPSAAGEAALVRAVLAFLPKAGRVADLFAGCGTFAFVLSRHAAVHAVESDKAAVEALVRAASRAGLAGRVTAERRNLESYPLAAPELDRFDAVVFDPPRRGAKAQAAALAQSAVPVVIAVSCDPKTFARDARLLVDGGYRLESVVPVDQFTWAAHVELVARFLRAKS